MAVFQPPPTWAEPVLVNETTGKVTFNPVWLKWFLDLIEIINASGVGGGGGIQHNDTVGLQGGSANQFYHLTAAKETLVNGLVQSATAYNAAAVFIAALSATSAQVNQLAVGLSTTITTAKLTGGGANGSMTFTNGVLTAQTAAT